MTSLIVHIRSQVNMCIRHDHRALERSELLFGSLVYKSDFSKIYFFFDTKVNSELRQNNNYWQ